MIPKAFDRLRLRIGGRWIGASSAAGELVLNPANGRGLGTLPHADEALLEASVAAAREGFARWRESAKAERAEVLANAADLLEQRRAENALLMTLEQGKPLAESEVEWDRVVDTLRWHAGAVERLADVEYSGPNGTPRIFSRLEPVGICVGFTAWNFPALLPARKLAPALAAGCSMILKASEETPASAVALVAALAEAGLPDGVVNLVFGEPARISRYLLTRPEVRKCTFTGSVAVGKLLAGIAAEGLKRCTLELGGHAPVLVFGDADVEQAVAVTGPFKFRNAGQACIAPTRFYVDRAVYARFLDAFVAYTEGIRVGDGTDPATTMGPMANERRIAAMRDFCTDALERGGTIVTGGGRGGDDGGLFWQPTVMTGVPSEATVMRVEPFGPIAVINPFDDLDQVLGEANRLQYGLAAYVFTGSPALAERVVNRIEAGGVVVNGAAVMQADTPFGGVKESGYGYEGGFEGIAGFLHKKLVTSYLG